METDQIRTDTDSDISNNHICVFFQFPSLGMETDRIHTDTNSDISDIFEYLFFCFLTVSIPSNGSAVQQAEKCPALLCLLSHSIARTFSRVQCQGRGSPCDHVTLPVLEPRPSCYSFPLQLAEKKKVVVLVHGTIDSIHYTQWRRKCYVLG
jgi:hypothetical protein